MSPAGRKSEGKKRYTLTLDPDLVEAVRKVDSNLSRFLEGAGWVMVKRLAQQKRVGPNEGPRA